MKSIAYKIIALCLCLGLVACANMNNQDTGTLAGGAIGGLLGSQFGKGNGRLLATASGALLGAYLGNRIGQNMDQTDQLRVQQALESTKTGQAKAWTNPDNHTRYRVKPKRTYYRKHANREQPCREYQLTAWVEGKRQQVYGTACRQADGSWKAQS